MKTNKNKNIFLKMADYLYEEDAQKKAYLRGCADVICLMRNSLDTVVKVDELITDDDQFQDIKVLNTIIYNNRQLTEEDVKICKLLDKPITACNLSLRSLNALTKIEVKTVKDLLEKFPDGDLSVLRGIGRKSRAEINNFLNENNLFFGIMSDPIVIEKYAIYKWR